MVNSSSDQDLTTPQFLHDGFINSANRYSSNLALDIAGRAYTYAELYAEACLYCQKLRELGVKPGERVGLLLGKSFPLYSAILGTLMAGGAYVPLDPGYPPDRLNLIIHQADPKVVVCMELNDIERLKIDSRKAFQILQPIQLDRNGRGEETCSVDLKSSDIAYILFTSGSTGVPKGVMVTHENSVAFTQWGAKYCSVVDNDRMSGHSDLNFDLSVFDTFVAWTCGACLVPVIDLLDRTAPGGFIKTNTITIWFSVPSVISGMAALGDLDPKNLQNLRWALFCGEALLPSPVRMFMEVAPNTRIANLYGPTEATVACSAYELTEKPDDDSEFVPIGWKTEGTEIFCWHKEGREAQTGETGEILISGDQVASGYWRNEKQTQECFVFDPRNPDGNIPCYKTGDLGTVLSDGPVFKGRLDSQVKFRGWRIELGDIEQALARQKNIIECAASLLQRPGKNDLLVAFARCSKPLNANALLAELREILPTYMVPTHIRFVDDFPRTLNGKIDRKQLVELF